MIKQTMGAGLMGDPTLRLGRDIACTPRQHVELDSSSARVETTFGKKWDQREVLINDHRDILRHLDPHVSSYRILPFNTVGISLDAWVAN